MYFTPFLHIKSNTVLNYRCLLIQVVYEYHFVSKTVLIFYSNLTLFFLLSFTTLSLHTDVPYSFQTII